MGFFSDVGDKVKKLLDQGDLIADLGMAPLHDSDQEVSASIRRYPGKPPHLLFHKRVRTHPGIQVESFDIACTIERAEYLEKVAREIRRQVDAPAV